MIGKYVSKHGKVVFWDGKFGKGCCYFEDCTKAATYGQLGRNACYCFSHKQPGMVDVTNKRCACGRTVSFGYAGQKPTACASCKTPLMVCVRKRNLCACGVRANYGLVDGRATACRVHKTEEMVDVAHSLCPCGVRKNIRISRRSANGMQNLCG